MTLTIQQLEQIAENPQVFLSQAYRTKERITAKRERIDGWRQIAESTTAQMHDTPSGGSLPSNKVAMCACNIVDLQDEIEEEIRELLTIEQLISAAIGQLIEDPNYKVLLELRYLNRLKWEEIAVRLDRTFRWVMTLHKRSLEEISSKALQFTLHTR